MARLFRQTILCVVFGPTMAAVTVISWFTIWPFMAAMEWLHDGQVGWRGLREDSLGFWNEFTDSLRAVK